MTISTTTPVTGSVSDWARDLTAPQPASQPARTAPRGLASALVAAPLAMTAWFLVEPSVLPREDAAVFLGSVAASPDRYLLATGFVALAGALGVAAALAVGRLLRPRLPRTGPLLALVLALSGLGLWAQVGFRLVVASLVRDGSVPDSAVASYTAFQEAGLFDVLLLPGLALGALGTLGLMAALVRTRLVPLWVPPLLLVSAVLASGEFADPVTVGGAALGVVGNLALARALLRA